MTTVDIDDLVTFNHVFRFTIDRRNKFMKASFVTIYANSLVEWEVLIHNGPFRHGTARADPRFRVKLRESGSRDVWPTPSSVQYQLSVFDENSEQVASSMIYNINILGRPQQHPRNILGSGSFYETDPSSSFCTYLTKILEGRGVEKTVELSTTIEYRKIELASKRALNTSEAAPVPIELNYTFDSLVNSDRFDIKLKTLSGHFKWANKEMLFIASDYFRDNLTEKTTEILIDTDRLETIEVVLTYLLTGKYRAPVHMTPSMAGELLRLANRWKVCAIKIFKNSLERHCYDELCVQEENLQFVVEMMLAAQENNMTNLFNPCLAIIITHHFTQFCTDYLSGTHPLREGLTARRGLGRPSLAAMVKKKVLQMADVQCFTRKLVQNVDE